MLIKERPINDGIQKIYRFKNNFGASVVRHSFSYGKEKGLWELAVLEFDGDEFSLTYKTSVTDDVLGWLTDEEVAELLDKIEKL